MKVFKNFVLDVDGVLNDGKIYWGTLGKPLKVFGNYDHDGLKLLRNHLEIEFVSADKTGWDITYNRITEHMGFKVTLVSEKDRYEFVKKIGFENTIFMGDGPYDAKIIREAGLGIAPAQAWDTAKKAADFVTTRNGGDGAVMEACCYIMNMMEIKNDL